MNLIRKRLAVPLGVLSLAFTGVIATSPTASAGTWCAPPFCSQVANRSSLGVLALRNWCGESSTHYGANPPCGPLASQETRWIQPTRNTPATQDWDGFRVDAGYCYVFRTHSVLFGWNPTVTLDRRGKGAMWMKVADDELAYVQRQSTSSC